MGFAINDIIRFNSGEYLILDIIRKDDNTYLYLINNDEFKNDVSITKVVSNNGVVEYTYIDNEEEFNYVLSKLFLNNENELLDFLIEE